MPSWLSTPTRSHLVPPVAAFLLAALLLIPRTTPAWRSAGDATPQDAGLLSDTASLATGPYTRMHALLERTIFQVDVLTLEIRVDEETARALERIAAGNEYSERRANSVAAVMVGARDVFIRMCFQRGIGLDRLLDGIRENLASARDAGIVNPGTYEMLSDSLGPWYASLEDRGIREGDSMMYRIQGDSLRVVYRGVDGRVLLNQLRVSRARSLAVLGGYFAPDAELREGLVRSLFRQGD